MLGYINVLQFSSYMCVCECVCVLRLKHLFNFITDLFFIVKLVLWDINNCYIIKKVSFNKSSLDKSVLNNIIQILFNSAGGIRHSWHDSSWYLSPAARVSFLYIVGGWEDNIFMFVLSST